MAQEKIQTALEAYLSRTYSGEPLKEFVTGTERLNSWLEIFLLGPIAGAAGTRNYYIGLTDKRMIFIALNWWTSQPTDDVSEIPLGRISEMKYKKGTLNGKLTILYGEDVKRIVTIYRRQFENARRFVDAYNLLSKPLLTNEEIRQATASEAAYKQEVNDRMVRAVGILVGVVVLVILLNIGSL